MHRTLTIVFFIGLILIIVEGSSIAESNKKRDQQYGSNNDWSVRFGGAGMYKPEYEGSDDYEFQGFPMIDVTWRDMIFLNPRKGLGAYLWNQDGVKLGVSIGYAFGRDEDDSNDLNGLGDIDGGATANVLLEWEVEDFSIDARYEHQVTGDDTGFQAHIGLGYDLRLGEKTILKPSVQTTYSSSDYMEEYFSISPSQSARSGLIVYEADSGFKSVGLSIMSIYRINQKWGVHTMARYGLLLGDTADSPVVKDENQYLLSIGVSYTFM
jgi:outer membrane scaffolding protein for murein synthesis (MipA/OmpV family)